ncbi:MAG: Gfo/Idh/MocA family protein, partial [Deinococcus sp.]
GGIARAFAGALHQAGGVEVAAVAVASRTRPAAEQFAQEYGLAAYQGYGALLRSPDIDAVYNALPNSLHAEWTIRAAQAGKHVLCEKPLAVSLSEARTMFAAAEEHGVVLLEAFPYAFQPQTLRTVELCREGAIGSVRQIQAAFGFAVQRSDDVRLSAPLAGGALMDVGCYPVSFARMVIGQRPGRVSAAAQWGESRVDLSLAGTLEYPDGATAQIACSLVTSVYRQAAVLGSQGTIETDFFNHAAQGEGSLRLKRGVGRESRAEEVEFERGNGFVFESVALARQVRRPDDVLLAELKRRSLDNAATLEALLNSARQSGWVEVQQP